MIGRMSRSILLCICSLLQVSQARGAVAILDRGSSCPQSKGLRGVEPFEWYEAHLDSL